LLFSKGLEIKSFKEKLEDIIELDNLYFAYLKTKKTKVKPWAREKMLLFEKDLGKNLFNIQDSILNDLENYKAQYTVFDIFDKKHRTILAPSLKDCIAQRAIYDYLNPFYERTFIHNSFACRPGKGIHTCKDKTKEIFKNSNCLIQMDIEKYFDSIEHKILLDILAKRIKDKNILFLLSKYFGVNKQGLPMGNLLSQLFSNIFLNELDQYVVNYLKLKYIRYMDDFVISTNSLKQAQEIKFQIEDYLYNYLNLNLSKYSYNFKYLNFAGYRHFKGDIYRTEIRKSHYRTFTQGIEQNKYYKSVSILGLSQGTNTFLKLQGELNDIL